MSEVMGGLENLAIESVKLKMENMELKSQLKKAEAVIDFYGDEKNYASSTIKMSKKDDDGDQYSWYGGKRAREYRKEFPKEGV